MKEDSWMVSDAKVLAETGRDTTHWTEVFDRFEANTRKPAEVINHLIEVHGVARAWAKTLATRYQKGIR